jgi:uncharacterized membrane protein YfcA
MEPFIPIILALAGFVGGFVGSEVGAGGLMTLPVLLFLGLSPAQAVASNSISAWLINAIASYEYWRSRKVHLTVVAHLAPIALVGSVIGARLMTIVDQKSASLIIAILFIAVFFVLFIALRHGVTGLKAGSARYSTAKKITAGAVSFALGIYGGFFAVGVTTLFVVALVFLLRKDFMQAAADAVAISAVFLLGSLIEYGLSGFIIYEYAIPLGVGSIFGAYLGSKKALKFGNHWLKFLVMAVVLLVIGKLAYASF